MSVQRKIGFHNITLDEVGKPLSYGSEAHLSREYFFTYEIADDSIFFIRSASDRIKESHNVCPHRGRRLINTPCEQNGACGTKRGFVRGFHGWTFDLEGRNTHFLDRQGALASHLLGRGAPKLLDT